jgi:putative aldouronate transport system substrate-binding protein
MLVKKTLTRRSFLAAVGVTALAAACAPQATPVPAPAPKAAEPTKAPAQAAAPAATKATAAEVNLNYIFRASPPKDLQTVQDALSKLVKEKINATVTLTPIEPAAYDEKIKLKNAAGEPYDLVFTAPWTNNYFLNVANGNLVALDDLLMKHAPGLWGSMTPATWEAARVSGKIYGSINQQIFVKPWGIYPRQDLWAKYSQDISKVEKFTDLEPYLDTIKTKEQGITPTDKLGMYYHEFWGYDPLDDGAFIAIKADDPDLKVFNTYESDGYKQTVEWMFRWWSKGWVPKDEVPAAENLAAWRAGKYAVGAHVIKPGQAAEEKVRLGHDFLFKSLTKNILTTAGCTATMNGVSVTSKNPERTVMLLELLNTDKVIYNTMCRGVEGKHWEWVDKAKEVVGMPQGMTPETNPYNLSQDWMFGNQFLAYYKNAAQVGSWEETAKLNKDAKPSAALGFTFKRDNVKTELAQVTAIKNEVGKVLDRGAVDPAKTLPEYISKLKQAGIDKIAEEMQKQLQEWKATKKK